jgi:hypothetical protein
LVRDALVGGDDALGDEERQKLVEDDRVGERDSGADDFEEVLVA